MPRVVGIDPGTVSFGVLGLEDGHVFLESSLPTSDVLLDGEAACLLPRVDKEAARGAALIADGLAGGRHRELVDSMSLRDSRGSALDWLYLSGADEVRRWASDPVGC